MPGKRHELKFNPAVLYFVIFLLGWTLVSMVASQYIIGFPMVALLSEKFSQPVWTCIYDALVYILALTLVLFVPPQFFKVRAKRKAKKGKTTQTSEQSVFATNSEELGVQHTPTFTDVGLAPIGYIVYLMLSAGLTSLMSLFSWFDAEQVQDVGFSHYLMGGDRIIAMIALVFIAPVAEEIIMRGWLYGKLRTKLKAPLAIILVSALFGLLHGQWNVAIATFALSTVLCTLREITGTIWAGILLHMLSNGVAFYILYVASML